MKPLKDFLAGMITCMLIVVTVYGLMFFKKESKEVKFEPLRFEHELEAVNYGYTKGAEDNKKTIIQELETFASDFCKQPEEERKPLLIGQSEFLPVCNE